MQINKFKREYESFRGNRYEAQIVDWNPRFKNPLGKLIRIISGNSNNKTIYREPQRMNSSGPQRKNSTGLQRKNSTGPQRTNSGGITISLIKDDSNHTIRKVDSVSSEKGRNLRNSRSSNFKEQRHSKSISKSYYEAYLSKKDIDEGLKNKTLLKGKLFIDEWKGDSYVKIHDSEDKIIINSDRDRNRGLDGDEVVVKVLKEAGNKKIGKYQY